MRWTATIMQAVFETVGQPAELGALPTLMAATADLPGSTYVGPSGLLQFRGHPRIVATRPLAQDREARRELWELSERATGVRFLDGASGEPGSDPAPDHGRPTTPRCSP